MATGEFGPPNDREGSRPSGARRHPSWSIAWTFLLAALLSLPMSALAGPRPGVAAPTATPRTPSGVLAATGAAFLENRGQVRNGEVRYSILTGNLHIGMVPSGLLIETVRPVPAGGSTSVAAGSDPMAKDAAGGSAVDTIAVRVAFEGSNRVPPQGRGELPFRSNFLVGSDPSRWQVGVASYGEVVYPDLYGGIDLIYHAGQAGLKYEFLVHPGADPAQIRWSYAGADRLEIRDGALVVRTALGELDDAAPIAEQAGATVPCHYTLRGRTVGVACDAWNPAMPLTIDPLLYSTFLGGSQDSRGTAITVDAVGDAYVTGFAMSTDFPATTGAYQTSLRGAGSWDAFVLKLNPSGTGVVYATYLGGSGNDRAFAIAVDGQGDAFVTGYTNSTNFPTTPGAFRTTFTSAVMEAFVTELNPAGSGLVYSTLLGGTGDDRAYAIALDASGEAIVAGRTKSTDFPVTTGAFQTTFKSTACGLTLCGHGFVSKLAANGGSLVYSSFLGGAQSDRVLGIALDASGDAFVTGYTNSSDFPATAGAYGTTFHGGGCGAYLCSDAYVAKVNPTGTALLFSTFLGGSKADQAHEVAVDGSGDAVVTGETNSTDFPVTAGAFETRYPAGFRHAFVTKLNAMGSGLMYSTFLGGSNTDFGEGVALDAYGDAYITGRTNSSDFPTTPGAYDTVLNAGSANDVFVTELSPSGGQLVYSTFLGGSGDDWGNAIALDGSANAYVTGHTFSLNFPTTPGAFRTAFTGIAEAYATKLSLALAPTVRITSPSPGAVATTSATVTGTSARATLVQVRPGSAAWVNATGVASWTATLDLTALPTGSVVIEARAFNGTVESAHDTVTIHKVSTGPGLDRCTVSPDIVAIQVGGVQAFSASGWNGTTEIAGVSATWSSSSGIGTVSPAGMFSATQPGVGFMNASVSYGGRSAACAARVTVTLGPPPTVAITSPSSGSNVTTDLLVVHGTSADADAVQVRAGTGSWSNIAGNLSAWSAQLNLSGFPAGRSLVIEARSFNGTVESTHDRIAILKVLALALTISYPADRAQVSGTLNVTGTATPGSTVEVRFDSGPWRTVPMSGTGWSYVIDTTATFDGAHLIEARAVNGTAASPIIGREIVVSNPPPPTPLLSPTLLWGITIAAVLTAVAVILLAVRRRRRRREVEAPGLPPHGERPG